LIQTGEAKKVEEQSESRVDSDKKSGKNRGAVRISG
jgi:hypothetical protein